MLSFLPAARVEKTLSRSEGGGHTYSVPEQTGDSGGLTKAV